MYQKIQAQQTRIKAQRNDNNFLRRRVSYLEKRNTELRKALDSVLGMFDYPDSNGMRLFYATDGTKYREETLSKARKALARSDAKE